jgi:hypothetical protein
MIMYNYKIMCMITHSREMHAKGTGRVYFRSADRTRSGSLDPIEILDI